MIEQHKSNLMESDQNESEWCKNMSPTAVNKRSIFPPKVMNQHLQQRARLPTCICQPLTVTAALGVPP